MDEDERQRKLEAGRAKLASFRQRRAKVNGAGTPKKTQKGKGQAVTQNDRSAQDRPLVAVAQTVNDVLNNTGTNHDVQGKQTDGSPSPGLLQTRGHTEQTDAQKNSPSLGEGGAAEQPGVESALGDEDLVALTGKEQLRQLQRAVEKRNEIITRLSSNLQEALSSREQVQQEVQSMAGQIQDLQVQLQQTSQFLQRSTTQVGSKPHHTQQQNPTPGLASQDLTPSPPSQDLALSPPSQDLAPGQSSGEPELRGTQTGLSSRGAQSNYTETETEALLEQLRTELEEEKENHKLLLQLLEEEKENNRQAHSLLEEEKEKHTHVLQLLEEEKRGKEDERRQREEEKENHEHVLSLLEEERREREAQLEEERREREAQLEELHVRLSQAQSQTQELLQEEEEKEALNSTVQELRRRLREEEAEREKQEEQMERLREESRRVRQLLEEKERGMEAGEGETWACGVEESHARDGVVDDGLNVSVSGGVDLLMERYLTAVPSHHPHSSSLESLEEHSLLENSDNYRFELDSELLGETSRVFASYSLREEPIVDLLSYSVPRCTAAGGSLDQEVHQEVDQDVSGSLSQWLQNSADEREEPGEEAELHLGKEELFQGAELEEEEEGLDLGEEPGEEGVGLDLGKELLIQQCGDLREELALREREQEVLREEVQKSAEDLEEARSRWSQATEELQEALWELEEEKEKRRRCEDEVEEEKEKRRKAEEEIHLKSHEEDNLKNKLSALLEEREKEKSQESQRSLHSSIPPVLKQEDLREVHEELKEVHAEKAVLLARLKQQEQLVTSLQEMKHAGDSVTSEVQVLFGKQLQALQAHRDQAFAELEENRSRLRTTAALLGQRTLELDSARQQLEQARAELRSLGAEAQESRRSLERTEGERAELESQLVCLRQNLSNLEEAQTQAAREKEEHRRRRAELDGQISRMEELLEEELEEFQKQLNARDEEVAEAKEKWEEERQEKDEEVRGVRRLLEEQRKEREEEVQALLEKQAQAVEEATERLRTSQQEEVQELQENHQEEVQELKARLEEELSEQRAAMEEEQRRQISLIKQVTEREHQRMMSELCATQGEELGRLRAELSAELQESLESAHQAELQQTRAQQQLEMEALRLSLTNLHTAQLELSQANLQREREAALSEVQDSLREKWAQEKALLQGRQQFLLDQLREQNQEREERTKELHQRTLEALEDQQAKDIQTLKLQWQEESERLQANFQTSLSEAQASVLQTQAALTQTQADLSQSQAELSQTQASFTQSQAELSESRAQLEMLQASSQTELQRLEEELTKAWADRDAAARAVEDLVSRHREVLQERQEHVCQLEEREKRLQQEVVRGQEEQVSLKKSSQQEVAHLWAQLDSMRTSRQELGELKEQLLARSSRVDDIERLKTEFSEQKREIRQQNETELENLRRYFEQRLGAAEEGYREEITLLQLRLVEGALDDSTLKTGDASFMSEGKGEEERNEMLAEITLKLEKHKGELDALRLQLEERHTQEMDHLRSCMALSYKEELLQVRTDLTDRYYDDLQEMKTRHSLELEQLRAKLSDSHVRELTRIRLEAARQVEVEVEQRTWGQSEELQTKMTVIQTLETRLSSLTQQHADQLQRDAQQRELESLRLDEERARAREEEVQRLREELLQENEEKLSALRRGLEEERMGLEKQLEEEREKLRGLQASLDNDQNPQLLAMRQKLEAQYDGEMSRAKSCMASEVKELTALLQEQGDERLRLAQDRFQEERGQLEQRLAQQQELSLGELRVKHQGDLELLRTSLLTNHTQEMNALQANHEAELDVLSASHKDQIAAMVTELDVKHGAELAALESSLEAKRKAELDRLEAVLEETNQAQLEAQEAELERRHQEEREELERRMLGNMDTLEATYLKEVQTLREERQQLEAEHQQEVTRLKESLRQEAERDKAEQLSVREELRRKLAQVHMEKFGAMATELRHAHQTELDAQREALEAGHHLALEALRKQVLELEQQHSTGLAELALACNAEKDQLTAQHQVQLQELWGASARELHACRREQEEGAARQRLHFLEEGERLKVQSDERLQDRITQLKAEFEKQKEAELEQQRRSLASEHEQKEHSYTEKMSQLTAQLQQLDTVVSQLRAEVGCLQGALEGKRVEMETLDSLLQRRDRESQEGETLLRMLTQDLHTAKEDRHQLELANEKLGKVLLEVVRSTMATEELIERRVSASVGVRDPLQGAEPGQQTANRKSSVGSRDTLETEMTRATDMSASDLELSQRVCESLLLAPSGGEEAALQACARLRHTVDTLLELLNQANTQLQQTHGVHLSLEERFSQGREDSAQLVQQHTLLLAQLDQEAGLKSQLQLELHKAKGLVEGYVAEKALLEESLQQKESQEERLVEELEGLRVQLGQMEGLTAELEGLRTQLQERSEENALLLRQRDHLSAGLGDRERGLLAEAERLAQERVDVQRQAEKDQGCLALRLRALEAELEDRETRGLEADLQHRAQTEDLGQRVQALEKQLKHNRQFIDEQAVEREHERDEFQQEIFRLEAQLRYPSRGHSAGDAKGQRIEDLVLQVESLQALIKDKTEDHASLLAANQQAHLDVAERNEEIDKMAGRIRELEQALLSSAESNRALGQLEQELNKARQKERDLVQDKQALEQQQLANRLQISALQSSLDETRHRYHDNAPDPTQQLREALDTAQENLHRTEQQAEVLIGQLEQVQRDLTIKEAEVKHLTLQLELLTNQNAEHVSHLQEQIEGLKETVSSLSAYQEERERGDQEERERGGEEEESLPSALLQEKNQEIDQLTLEVQRLQQDLENTRNTMATEAELEHLHSQVEHLDSDLIRLRQDKQEEEERLHEVISTLQAELATLGPALHEVSDSQEGDSPAPSPSPSPEPPRHPRTRSTEGGDSLKQELRLLHSSSSRSVRSHTEALRGQLEVAVAEKEAMERLLLAQEEEYRGQGEELGRRLREERERAEELQRRLSVAEAELEEARARSEELEDGEEKAQLDALLLELRRAKEEDERDLESLRTRDEERKRDLASLRATVLSLEEQVQDARAEVVATETLVAEGKAEAVAMETAKAELSAEREALRRREGQLQEEMERLAQEVTSLRARVQELNLRLEKRGANQEEAVGEVLESGAANRMSAEKEALTAAETTTAQVEFTLQQKEAELVRLGAEHQTLGAEHQTLRVELASLKEGLSSSTERAERLQKEGQTKERALADLEAGNQCLKAELRVLQDNLAEQGEELAYQQRELHLLRQHCSQQDTPLHSLTHSHKDVSHHHGFQDVCVSSLGSPEVLRRLECSEDRTREFHSSALQVSRLSDLNGTDLELLQSKASTLRGGHEAPPSRTITPEPATHSTRSPGSVSASDNFSVLDSLDADKVRELDTLDLTAPPSPLGSISSLSAPEWASDGYGSNVSSELGLRLRVELEQTERLDAQFIQYLRYRGMNPAANTDSAAETMSYHDELLSPELQGLLRRVYQESCRVLALSQRHAPSQPRFSSDAKALLLDRNVCQSGGEEPPLDQACEAAPPLGWQQEKRALQETVIALRELLCRMAQRDTQVEAERQQHDGQVEVRLREELEASRQQLNAALNTQHELQSHVHELQTHVHKLRLSVQECEEALKAERSKVQELLLELEQERTHAVRREKEEEERREVERASMEQQGSEVVALRGQLAAETVTCSNLRQELQIEQSRGLLLQSQLEQRLADAHKALEHERHHSASLQDVQSQDRSRQEALLRELEASLSSAHGQMADAHRKLEEERERCCRQLDDVTRTQEADMARDRKFISDLRAQLEQERRQGEELAATTDRLRAELLQSRRSGEEEERRRSEESQKEQEATARLRVTVATLKEQKQEVSRALEAERESSGRQRAELKELREKTQLLKEKEREREEQRERERRKERQEQTERERRHERTSNKLGELELLRQQDQQRMKALQQTLAELERDEKKMAAQRLAATTAPARSNSTTALARSNSTPPCTTKPNQQVSSSSSGLVEKLRKENAELAARVTGLSQERVAHKHALAGLETQLRRSENELARVTAETRNKPVIAVDVNNAKLQRLYERYLRAESFRKALVYQKRYLLLLLGGFQDCEQATLCLIASMGAHPSPALAGPRRPLTRFRAAVRAVVAISRLKFLTRKWQKAIKKSSSTSSIVNGHVSGSRTEVLRLQRSGANQNTSPPTRNGSPTHQGVASTLVPPIKSPFLLHQRVYSNPTLTSGGSGGTATPEAERSLTEYIHHLESIQQRLGGARPGSANLLSYPKSDH